MGARKDMYEGTESMSWSRLSERGHRQRRTLGTGPKELVFLGRSGAIRCGATALHSYLFLPFGRHARARLSSSLCLSDTLIKMSVPLLRRPRSKYQERFSELCRYEETLRMVGHPVPKHFAALLRLVSGYQKRCVSFLSNS